MSSTTRQRANQRLMEVQAQMFVLGEEAKQLAGFLNIAAAAEDDARHYAKQASEAQASEETAIVEAQASEETAIVEGNTVVAESI